MHTFPLSVTIQRYEVFDYKLIHTYLKSIVQYLTKNIPQIKQKNRKWINISNKVTRDVKVSLCQITALNEVLQLTKNISPPAFNETGTRLCILIHLRRKFSFVSMQISV